MKNLIYLSLALLLNACVDQASSDIEFTLYNETDRTVKVLGFDTQLDVNTNGKAVPIVIEPNSHFKVTRFTGLDDNLGNAFYSIQGVDSVRVIFDNIKVQVLTLENTFNQGQTIFQGNENYEHFITEQDYEGSVPCNGSCE